MEFIDVSLSVIISLTIIPSSFGPVAEVCNLPSEVVMQSGRGVVRVVAPGQVETIKRCHPLVCISAVSDISSHITAGPLSKVSNMLL